MECVALIVRFSVHITKFLCEIYKGNSRPFKIPRLESWIWIEGYLHEVRKVNYIQASSTQI